MKTTILVESDTRDRLKKIGHMGQTYDELIQDLIECKRKLEGSPVQKRFGEPRRQ